MDFLLVHQQQMTPVNPLLPSPTCTLNWLDLIQSCYPESNIIVMHFLHLAHPQYLESFKTFFIYLKYNSASCPPKQWGHVSRGWDTLNCSSLIIFIEFSCLTPFSPDCSTLTELLNITINFDLNVHGVIRNTGRLVLTTINKFTLFQI